MTNRKWIVGVLSTAMATSILSFPSISAAKMNHQGVKSSKPIHSLSMVEQLKQQYAMQQKWLKSKGIQRKDIKKVTVKEAHFKGKIDSYQTHQYQMVVDKAGTVQIDAKKSNAKVRYALIDTKEFQEYKSGDPIPAGEYFLGVTYDYENYPPSEVDVPYELKISGVSMSSVDNTVPEIRTATPTKHELRVSPDTKTFHIKGSAKGADRIDVSVNYTTFGLAGLTYSEAWPLKAGDNSFRINALEMSGNMASESFQVVKPEIQRFAGANPASISVEVSKKQYPTGSNTIIIANTKFTAEALNGNALSMFNDAPILLTDTKKLPSIVTKEIQRLEPSKAIILGGTNVVSVDVEKQLKKLGLKVERQKGENRFASTAQMAEELVKISEGDTAIVVEGSDFSSFTFASTTNLPMLLVEKNRVPAETAAFFKKHPDVKNLIVVGEKGLLSVSVKKQLQSFGKMTEVTGANRFEVGINLINHFSKLYEMAPTEFTVVKDQDFATALVSMKLGSSILFTPSNSLHATVNRFLDQNKPNIVKLLGGKEVISTKVEQQLKAKLK